MKRMTAPVFDKETVYMKCVSSIPNDPENEAYISSLTDAMENVLAYWNDFDTCALQYDFQTLPACNRADPGQVIIPNVNKKYLTDLYTKYMVKGCEEARSIYDTIKASAPNRRCPFCGIGLVNNLDHYLPKARYPVFSVNPSNLVPSCDACNKGKASSTYVTLESHNLFLTHPLQFL